MVIKTAYIKFFLIILFTLTQIYAQNDQIEDKKLELEKLRTEISDLESELTKKSKSEKQTLEVYENINKQSYLVNKLVANLRKEENQKQIEIDNRIKEIKTIEKEIDLLQKNYAKYVISTYKYGGFTEYESILNAESFQQAVIRLEYLKRFSSNRKKDLVKLETNKKNLIEAKAQLEKEKRQKHELTAQKESEEKVLKQKLADQKKILNSIKKDRNKIAKNIDEKRKSEKKIRDLIIKLVEEAELKSKEEEKQKTEVMITSERKTNTQTSQKKFNVDLSTTSFASFAKLKGKLNWPISKGKVVGKFGETKNQKLNTVTMNYGIDIKAAGDLTVKCVAEGVVSAVEWLPGYGTVLIISHKGNYRTVYGHLGEVYVNEGDKIKTGGVIAKIGESVEGNILHFEIWSSRQNVNPELWLRK
jgi:septal ring factor EnvC (AmiA/AmiB activator)